MISSILFFSIGIPVHVIAEEKAFDPTDFSTYGLGMKESIGQESAPLISHLRHMSRNNKSGNT
jgi:hypothetical protein